MKNLILIIVFLLLCPSLVLAEEESKPNFKVKLTISVVGDDEDIKQTVESYISRELRSLGDVTVVDKGEAHLLWINVVDAISSGETLAFALSVVYCEQQDVEGLSAVQDEISNLLEEIRKLPESERQDLLLSSSLLLAEMSIALHTIDNYSMQNHRTYTGGKNDLRSLCEMAIVDFDNNYLKEKRKAIAEIKAMVDGEGEVAVEVESAKP